MSTLDVFLITIGTIGSSSSLVIVSEAKTLFTSIFEDENKVSCFMLISICSIASKGNVYFFLYLNFIAYTIIFIGSVS